MDVLTYSNARARLKQVMDRVVEDHTPVVVARHNGEAVVIVSLADWNAREETTHLLSSPKNAERLMASIRQLDAVGKGIGGAFGMCAQSRRAPSLMSVSLACAQNDARQRHVHPGSFR
jgi:antitoxin YefM